MAQPAFFGDSDRVCLVVVTIERYSDLANSPTKRRSSKQNAGLATLQNHDFASLRTISAFLGCRGLGFRVSGFRV